MINIDKSEITVNLSALTQLQKQLMNDIVTTAHAISEAEPAGHDAPTEAQLLAASEKCAVESYGARTPAGPSGELAAVYRAIGRALVGRPVEVSDAPVVAALDGWAAKGIHATRTVGDFGLYADEEGTWYIHHASEHKAFLKGRAPEQKNEEGTLHLAQRQAERELADKLRATLALLEG